MLVVKNPPANAGGIRDEGSVHGLGRRKQQPTPVFLPGENPMDNWQATVHRVAQLLLLSQSCPTLCDPVPGIIQARTLEWVAISFSNA